MKWQEFLLVPSIQCPECYGVMVVSIKDSDPMFNVFHPAGIGCPRNNKNYSLSKSSLPAMMLEEVE